MRAESPAGLFSLLKTGWLAGFRLSLFQCRCFAGAPALLNAENSNPEPDLEKTDFRRLTKCIFRRIVCRNYKSLPRHS
jgi:hypothetical protein